MVLSAEPGVRCLMMEPMRSTAIASVMYAVGKYKKEILRWMRQDQEMREKCGGWKTIKKDLLFPRRRPTDRGKRAKFGVTSDNLRELWQLYRGQVPL